ncbi:hypothetical protein BDW22DRAFT_1353961 [Trametopsis cervina]|nr:hypothetical protein BDW22DRAFT_1353961 [Trametopsis cervina]
MIREDGGAEEKPGRIAAKRAGRLTAQQLESSPPLSEDETGALSFGEPSHRKAQVKFTYAGKRSRAFSKSTPTKRTFATPPSLPRRLNIATKSDLSPATPSVLRSEPRKQIRNQPKRKRKRLPEDDTASLSSLTDIESDTESVIRVPPPPSRTRRPFTRTQSSPGSSTLRTHNDLKRKRKHSSSFSLDNNVVSDTSLAMLPSSSSQPLPITLRTSTPDGPGLRAGVAGLLSLTRSQSLSSLSTLSDTGTTHSGWGIGDHGLVFVCIDHTGNVSGSSRGIWWPAEVIESHGMTRVALYGEYPGSSAKAPVRELVVERSSNLVRPFCARPHQLRFSQRTYSSASILEQVFNPTPRKKQKTTQADLDRRWNEAKNLMLKRFQDMNDGIPLHVSHFIRDDTPSVVGQPDFEQRNETREPSATPSSGSADIETWAPESPYDIPGELVLAKEKRSNTQYWPAKLMRYFPPSKRGAKARYEVLFYDGKVMRLPDDSDMFFNEVHPNFKNCRLGQDEHNYGLNEGEKDVETDVNSRIIPDEEFTDELLRSSSPEPHIPAPVAFASDLSIEEQFRYTKPVLAAILTGRYTPAREKHIGFMKGGKQRNAVTMAAWKRGEVTNVEKEELSMCIVRWMRLRQKRQDAGLIPPDIFVGAEGADPSSHENKQIEIHVLDDGQSVDSVLTELSDSQSPANDTERAASSEVEGPPSSFITVQAPEDIQGPPAHVEIIDVDNVATPTGGIVSRVDVAVHDGLATHAVTDELDRPNSSSQEVPVEPPQTSTGVIPTFADLFDLDQITYCTSILLPEAILQILLWRNGERSTVELLPPSEEARLHRIAERHASATYWVHDIVNLKRAAEGKLLPVSPPPQSNDQGGILGMSRLRPRRK